MLTLWKQICVLAHHVVLQASLPYATVSIVARTDSVDGVNVPLSPCRHLERATVIVIKTANCNTFLWQFSVH